MNDDERAVVDVLARYGAAAGAGDAEAVAALYAPDGVLMAQGSRTAVGVEAVRTAYERMFGAIALSIRFEIAEARLLSQDWAFLRSTSSGTVAIKAAGKDVPEANQELFLFRKVEGDWRIARYSFSSMLET